MVLLILLEVLLGKDCGLVALEAVLVVDDLFFLRILHQHMVVYIYLSIMIMQYQINISSWSIQVN